MTHHFPANCARQPDHYGSGLFFELSPPMQRVSEDGALHAEKYYRTVTEEFAAVRPAFHWRQLVALARVTASEYGRPAPGMVEAREMLKV